MFSMNEYINNDNGTVSLDENVVAQVAGMTALDCFGIVGMGIVSVKDGIVKQLKGNNITQGIHVTFDENGDIVVELHIVVAYGVSISTVCDNLISTVQYSIEEMTGMKVKAINIFVEGVRVID